MTSKKEKIYLEYTKKKCSSCDKLPIEHTPNDLWLHYGFYFSTWFVLKFLNEKLEGCHTNGDYHNINETKQPQNNTTVSNK